jgi:hypothetical protein
LREKYFHNRVFGSLDALENHLVRELRDLENSPLRIKSITACIGLLMLFLMQIRMTLLILQPVQLNCVPRKTRKRGGGSGKGLLLAV